MALTTPFPEIPESRAYLAAGVIEATFLIIPGTSDYPTGGYSLAVANMAGFSKITGAQILGTNATGAPYLAQPLFGSTFMTTASIVAPTSILLMVLGSAGFTPAGTNSAPTISITGGTAGTVAIGISSDADNAALSKTAATSRVGITGVQAPVFTGTAVAAAGLVELVNGFNLTGAAWAIRIIGY